MEHIIVWFCFTGDIEYRTIIRIRLSQLRSSFQIWNSLEPESECRTLPRLTKVRRINAYTTCGTYLLTCLKRVSLFVTMEVTAYLTSCHIKKYSKKNQDRRLLFCSSTIYHKQLPCPTKEETSPYILTNSFETVRTFRFVSPMKKPW